MQIAIRALPLTFLAAVLAMTPAQAQAPVDVRIALVIGNSAYPGNELTNPANDARAMGGALRGLGFSVVELQDANREQMVEAVARIRASLKDKRGVGMLYYAGHGLQLDWRNYMVPVSARLSKAADVPAQAVDVNTVIEAFRGAGTRVNILVLDACRDNPFAATATSKGLAPVDAPPGTFLAYATAPGNVAEDGDTDSGNGLYTQHLLQELKKPLAKIEDVFKRVRFQVRQKSQGRQIPWESTSLEDDFYFDASTKPPSRREAAPTEAMLQAERSFWERIKDSGNNEDFYAYLQLFPNGTFSEQAQLKLNRKEQPKVVVAPTRQEVAAGMKPSTYTGDRLKPGDQFVFKSVDGFSKAVLSRFTAEILGTQGNAPASSAQSGLVMDTLGGMLSSETGRYSPPLVLLPAEFTIGNTWSGRVNRHYISFDGTYTGPLEYKARVDRRERITIEAGTFDAYVIQITAYFPVVSGRIEYTVWAVPEYGVPLRMQSVRRSTRPYIDIVEMTSIQAPR